MADDIRPLNEDEEGLLYLGGMTTDFSENADVIAEVIAADPNQVFQMNWRNASVTMRAGSWAAVFQRELLR